MLKVTLHLTDKHLHPASLNGVDYDLDAFRAWALDDVSKAMPDCEVVLSTIDSSSVVVYPSEFSAEKADFIQLHCDHLYSRWKMIQNV